MLLIVRGDLRSETGWSRATRALLAAIAQDFGAIAGVDMHYHPARSTSRFPGMILSDEALLDLLRERTNNVVLHATLPSGISRSTNAINLGWWFWETDRLPAQSDWLERLDALDHILVPSPWQAEIVRSLGVERPITIVPWPHQFPNETPLLNQLTSFSQPVSAFRTMTASELAQYPPKRRKKEKWYRRLIQRFKDNALAKPRHVHVGEDLETVLGRYEGYFFAIQSDAPRKGLAVLISEWCRYRATAKTKTALVIRFSSLDVGLDEQARLRTFCEEAFIASRSKPGLEDVYVIPSSMRDSDLGHLYNRALAFVAATYGEGFGGTLVEAAQNHCPIITPRHTACAQLVPDDYAGAYNSVPVVGALRGQLSIQPGSGAWHTPVPGEIAEQLRKFESLETEERMRLVTSLRSHMKSVLDPVKARRAVKEAIVQSLDAARASESTKEALLG